MTISYSQVFASFTKRDPTYPPIIKSVKEATKEPENQDSHETLLLLQ